ncbi:MAG: hypothetical protein MUC96_06610 [Myxococcaceae bacterium]|jgi:hypothetical protein|nr:hypothetical protein [Myxococcaceae bacterium]
MPVATGATCPVHVAVPAVEVCERCGRFVCGECLQFAQDGVALCTACFAKPHGRSTRSGLALALVLAGCLGCVPLTPIGIALAWLELRAIERGEAAAASKAGAQWALGLGLMQLAAGALLLVGLVGFRLWNGG